jgi:hypothetical protein
MCDCSQLDTASPTDVTAFALADPISPTKPTQGSTRPRRRSGVFDHLVARQKDLRARQPRTWPRM